MSEFLTEAKDLLEEYDLWIGSLSGQAPVHEVERVHRVAALQLQHAQVRALIAIAEALTND